MDLKRVRLRVGARRAGIQSRDELVAWAQRVSGRIVRVLYVDLQGSGACGVTVRIAGDDWVLLDKAGSTWSQTLILGHEIAHIVLGHLDGEYGQRCACDDAESESIDGARLIEIVAANVSGGVPDSISSAAARGRFEQSEERSAEALGTELAILALGGDDALTRLNHQSTRVRGRRIMSALTGG